MSTHDSNDSRVRTAAFAFLEDQVLLHGLELPRTVLQTGFEPDGARVPLLGPQGIFKPRVLAEMPLSIVTAPPVPGKPYLRPNREFLAERYDAFLRAS